MTLFICVCNSFCYLCLNVFVFCLFVVCFVFFLKRLIRFSLIALADIEDQSGKSLNLFTEEDTHTAWLCFDSQAILRQENYPKTCLKVHPVALVT